MARPQSALAKFLDDHSSTRTLHWVCLTCSSICSRCFIALEKKYKEWIQSALPWVIFGALSLGAGLILGGYWAYGVLGWGGWWGWDPVENSSLIPWIVAVIIVHTMLIQRMTGRFVRTNFILAVLAYLLVIYSTFLTRSGILANASVHSFVDPGSLAYTLLVMWLVAIAIGGFGMIIPAAERIK